MLSLQQYQQLTSTHQSRGCNAADYFKMAQYQFSHERLQSAAVWCVYSMLNYNAQPTAGLFKAILEKVGGKRLVDGCSIFSIDELLASVKLRLDALFQDHPDLFSMKTYISGEDEREKSIYETELLLTKGFDFKTLGYRTPDERWVKNFEELLQAIRVKEAARIKSEIAQLKPVQPDFILLNLFFLMGDRLFSQAPNQEAWFAKLWLDFLAVIKSHPEETGVFLDQFAKNSFQSTRGALMANLFLAYQYQHVNSLTDFEKSKIALLHCDRLLGDVFLKVNPNVAALVFRLMVDNALLPDAFRAEAYYKLAKIRFLERENGAFAHLAEGYRLPEELLLSAFKLTGHGGAEKQLNAFRRELHVKERWLKGNYKTRRKVLKEKIASSQGSDRAGLLREFRVLEGRRNKGQAFVESNRFFVSMYSNVLLLKQLIVCEKYSLALGKAKKLMAQGEDVTVDLIEIMKMAGSDRTLASASFLLAEWFKKHDRFDKSIGRYLESALYLVRLKNKFIVKASAGLSRLLQSYPFDSAHQYVLLAESQNASLTADTCFLMAVLHQYGFLPGAPNEDEACIWYERLIANTQTFKQEYIIHFDAFVAEVQSESAKNVSAACLWRIARNSDHLESYILNGAIARLKKMKTPHAYIYLGLLQGTQEARGKCFLKALTMNLGDLGRLALKVASDSKVLEQRRIDLLRLVDTQLTPRSGSKVQTFIERHEKASSSSAQSRGLSYWANKVRGALNRMVTPAVSKQQSLADAGKPIPSSGAKRVMSG